MGTIRGFIVFFTTGYFLLLFTKCNNHRPNKEVNPDLFILEKLKSEKAYSDDILSMNYIIGIHDLTSIGLSNISTDGIRKFIPFKALFSKNRKDKFIIRYNQVGCNTCVDLFFKNKKLLTRLSRRYEVLVLVDFSNYQDYVVWKKTSEMERGIYWLKKEKLPFDANFKENSYSFIVNDQLLSSKYFMPNNQFPSYVEKYVNDVTRF